MLTENEKRFAELVCRAASKYVKNPTPETKANFEDAVTIFDRADEERIPFEASDRGSN